MSLESIRALSTLGKSKLRKYIAPLMVLIVVFSALSMITLVASGAASTGTPIPVVDGTSASGSSIVCTLSNVVGLLQANANVPSLVCTFCSLYGTVVFIILFIALGLLALGGILYASAHLLPGQQRGGLQGYGFGLIIGGVVGIILVTLAPFIVTTLINSGSLGSGFNPFSVLNVYPTNTVANLCAGAGIL